MDILVFQQLAVSLGLGLLLGLERERRGSVIGGIRTFPIISLFGTVCAQVGQTFGGWVVAVGMLALAAIVVSANFAQVKKGTIDPGMTTEVAALLLYGVGVLIVIGYLAAAVVIAGAMALLLHSKRPLHNFARAVGERDMRAIMQFVLLSLVILPILPSEDYGPYGVWNPFKIWLMVVLIVGISLGGYVAYKFFGARAGSLLGGIIGGMVSSTATTVSYSRRAASEAALAPLAAFVIMTASCISIVRVLVEIAAVAPAQFGAIALPLSGMLVLTILVAVALFLPSRKQGAQMPEQKNPAELKPALIFRRPVCPRPAGGRCRKAAFWICGPLRGGGHFGPYRSRCDHAFYRATCQFQDDRHNDCVASHPHRGHVKFSLQVRHRRRARISGPHALDRVRFRRRSCRRRSNFAILAELGMKRGSTVPPADS